MRKSTIFWLIVLIVIVLGVSTVAILAATGVIGGKGKDQTKDDHPLVAASY